jgi:hypothetical protein
MAVTGKYRVGQNDEYGDYRLDHLIGFDLHKGRIGESVN